MPLQQNKLLLPVIIFSQFAGTSLWFAGNAIVDAVHKETTSGHANITSIVQFGFIAGTLVFALFTIADRFRSSQVFFFSSLIASAANVLIIPLAHDIVLLFSLRFITGFFLAGIYPVGMKIVADLFPQKMGKALGFLVGALVLGTSLPHLVRSQSELLNWEVVLLFTSALACIGGLLILIFIPTNQLKNNRTKPDLLAAFRVFNSKPFQSAAFGYFGHMWELYTFWALLPVLFVYYNSLHGTQLNVYFWSFAIIGIGAVGCGLGGLISQKWGSKKVAFYSLLISCLCSLLSGFSFHLPHFLFLLFLIVWGFTVTADSPQFSALVAKNAEQKNKGTALTIVTCIGFAITIISIQIIKALFDVYKERGLWILAIGPLIGLLSFRKLKD
jgi:MFS family permease